MTTKGMRKIVKIDEDKCTGCGLCVPSCAEGAIQIIDGKARLVAENLCDGLGNCLGECPEGAIRIEERPADGFDPQAVGEHLAGQGAGAAEAADCPTVSATAHHAGCPGSMLRKLAGEAPGSAPAALAGESAAASRLRQWPVQLALLPARGDVWQGADVLIAADCVAACMPDFHERLLAGKTLAIACPKLDDVGPYVEKLSEVFAANDVRSVTVAHMEVPCCSGLRQVVQQALARAGKAVGLTVVVVGIGGKVLDVNGVAVTS